MLGEELEVILDTAETTMKSSANSLLSGQLITTLFLSVSLK